MTKMRLLQICVSYTFLSVFFFQLQKYEANACSLGCTCTTIPARDGDAVDEDDEGGDVTGDNVGDEGELTLPQAPRGRKVSCSNNPYPFTSIEEVRTAITIPLDTIYLDLSKNEIAIVRKGSFSSLSYLQRLDLSENKISLIEPGAFQGLTQLTRLDLSHNKLGSVNGSIFQGLTSLQKLVLSNNKLNTVPDGTFNDLPALRRIDVQSEYLRCDCHLAWIVKWSKDRKVKIRSSTTCAVPRELNGVALKKLKKKDLHCDRPLELSLFEIMPGIDQIVFEGDKIPFDCQASIVDPKTEMFWLRDGAVVQTNRSRGVFIHTRKSPDNSVMMHSMVLENLKSPNSGEWICLVSTPQGNVTKTVTLVVIDSDAPQCEMNTTKTNKGVYVWKESVAGITKELPCKLGEGKVTHMCDKNGRWTSLNLSQCDFTNELTRKLQTLAKDTNSSKILSDARNLERLVSAPFRNAEDPLSTINPEYVDLASLAIHRLSQHAAIGDEIVKSVLLSASRIMNISEDILTEAQRQRHSLSRISKAVESIPQQMADKPKYSQSTGLIVMETRSFQRQQFTGIQCSRLDLKLDTTVHKMVQSPTGFVFVCAELADSADRYSFIRLDPLTSILVQKSVIHPPVVSPSEEDGNVTVTTTQAPTNSQLTFQFIWYGNANLFPITARSHDDPILRGKSWKVISAVLSVSLSEPVVNLTDPIELVFEVQVTDKPLVAAYWDYSANGGSGDWRTDGCDIIEKTPALVTVHCDHLTAFAILEDESLVAASMFQMMAIAVYIGSCVCLLCLMAVFITYVSCFRFLSVPRKMKHSVINICLSLLLLIIGFTMGVQRTDHLRACQVVGIVLHYLSLVVLFWFTVTASNMLKKFRKTEKPPPPPIDLPMPLPPKPIIRFYLLAWGVPTIICGITAAISFDFYTEPEYCFLDWQPSLGAFFGPVVFLLLLNVIFYLRIACIIRSSTGPLVNMEETQELQSNDIEMTHNHDRIETASLRSDMSTKSSVSSVMDSERRPVTQLRALALCLILFVFTWLFGAITVAKPFTFMPYQDIIFSYLYGVFCAILGLFMLIFFCLTRKDSLSSWKRFFLCEQHHVYNANPVMEACEPQANGHVNTGSGSEISKINSVVVTNHVNHVKKSDDEMSSIVLVPSKPTSDVNSSANNSLNEAAASFYNPKQNGVAKKFWDKKNKHNSKLLTKEMTKSLNIHASESEFSGSEQPRGQSLGYSSDGNTINKPKKLNLDLQIHRPAGCESDNTSAISPVQPQSPPSYTAAMTTSTPSAPPFSHMVNLHGQENRVGSPSAMQNGSIPANVYHARSNSSSSLGKRVQGSAFAVVPPRNNTLPKQGKLSLPSSPEREMPDNTVSVPSSVARLGDFDGSSQVSSSYSHERVRSPHPGDPQYMAGYTSPPDGAFYKQYGPIDERAVGSPTQSHNSHRNRTNSGGYGSDNSNRQRKQMENNFLQQVEQRIPQGSAMNSPYSPKPVNANHLHVNSAGNGVTNHNHVTHKPPISPVSDSDNNGSHKTFPDSDSQVHYNNKKPPARYNDSDHNSEPASQSQKMVRSRDTHKHSKHGLKKQRSLDWDEQFKEPKSPSQSVPYAYVNHNYTERVLQKLNNMAVTEHIDPKSKAFWVPRSSRSYNQLVQQEHARMCEDSTTSSSDDDDSLDNIWVLKKEKRAKKNKKETSV